MSLSLALEQIQKPTFWNDFSACERYESGEAKRMAQRTDDDLRAAAWQHLLTIQGPILHSALAAELEISSARLSPLLAPFYADQRIKRHLVREVLWIAASDFADFSGLSGKARLPGRHILKGLENRQHILDAIRAGHCKMAEIEQVTGLCHCTVSKHVVEMRGEGMISVERIPGSNALLLNVANAGGQE